MCGGYSGSKGIFPGVMVGPFMGRGVFSYYLAILSDNVACLCRLSISMLHVEIALPHAFESHVACQ